MIPCYIGNESAEPRSTAVPMATSCQDEHQGCPAWRSYCGTLPHIRKACRLSCGICVIPTQIQTRSPTTGKIAKVTLGQYNIY